MKPYSPYEIFIYVVEYKGITGAADLLGITKAAVSKTIKTLESSAKTAFFDRTHRSLKVTAAGKILYQHCKRIQHELVDTRAYLDTLQQLPQGELTIAQPSGLAKRFIFPKLVAFKKKYPGITMRFHTLEQVYTFDNDEIDITCGFSLLPNDDEITVKKIDSTRYVFCATPEYIQKNGAPKKIEDLSKHFYMGHAARPRSKQLLLKENKTYPIQPVCYSSNSNDIVDFALESLGIIQVQEQFVLTLLAQGKLIEILSEVSDSNVNLYLYYKKNKYTKPTVRAFIDFYTD
jgi:DNA-binding transcriptional LysR family regulator